MGNLSGIDSLFLTGAVTLSNMIGEGVRFAAFLVSCRTGFSALLNLVLSIPSNVIMNFCWIAVSVFAKSSVAMLVLNLELGTYSQSGFCRFFFSGLGMYSKLSSSSLLTAVVSFAANCTIMFLIFCFSLSGSLAVFCFSSARFSLYFLVNSASG